MNFLHVVVAVLGTGFIIFALHVLAAVIGVAIIFKYLPFFEKVWSAIRPRVSYEKISSFLEEDEAKEFKRISDVVGNGYVVLPHVSLAKLIKPEKTGWGSGMTHLHKKFVDFVIFEKDTMSPKLAIFVPNENTNDAHAAYRAREMDKILESSGLPYMRIEESENFENLLRQKFESITRNA